VLNTGDVVITSIGSTTFVADSETITLPEEPREVVFTPFDPASGSGQTVNVTLPDTSTVAVSYESLMHLLSFITSRIKCTQNPTKAIIK